ncbi:hypothetical protein [Actinomyces sp. MRS3W]|uniref:hypothetical protein n=1 Tax=Actinomyces sp. MRS3W TaxID=2800796 RepID=UPI0028FD6F77|nr:hypothetical protein [Actinomyces sp. MRS3W]MDU0347435.1 hypothetical protein [Actinomyces sp. MRS3W]
MVSISGAARVLVRPLLVGVVFSAVACVGGCADDSVAGPYCGIIAEEDVIPIVGRVTEVEDHASAVLKCDITGERGTLVAYGTDDSWVRFGRGGNNAVTTLEAITGGEGREVPGTDARVFSLVDDSYPDAYAYWFEGRAAFAMYTVGTDGVDESTAAELEELVIKYAPQVLDGVAARTEDPGPNRNDPSATPTATATAEPSSADQ